MPSRLQCLAALLIATSRTGIVEASSGHRNLPSKSPRESFRPQSHIVRVEKYRFEPQINDTHHQGLQDLHSIPEDADSMEASGVSSSKTGDQKLEKRKLWNGFDDLDKLIIGTTLPLSAIFAIMPISMTLDLFWVNRLGDALAVAGQSAANQVYNSAFWLFSFLPSVTATLVSKAHSAGDLESTQDAVCQALIVALMISVIGTSFMFFRPARALASILKDGSSAMHTARPYLVIRAFSFMPMLISFVGFSTFRGIMDVKSSVKIALTANAVTALLDPLLIHVFGIGVRGAALATLSGDVISSIIYLKLLLEKNLIKVEKLLRVPSWKSMAPLLKGGVALQIRSFAMNLTGILVARTVQSIDENGVAPAAHALVFQFIQMGGILLGALGMSTQTMVPNAMSKGTEEVMPGSRLSPSDALVRRLFKWGLVLGLGIGSLQLLLLPNILLASPLLEVREAARTPALIAITFQGINGIINVGEGILMGTGNFTWLSINIVLAAFFYAVALKFLSGPFGLTGVWMSLAVFTVVRLAGVLANPLIRRKTGILSDAKSV